MKCRGIAGVTEQGKHLPALHVIAIGHEHRILRRARRPGGDQVKAMQQGGGRMAVLVHREVQQKEPASAGLYRRCRFVSASRGAQPSGQSIGPSPERQTWWGATATQPRESGRPRIEPEAPSLPESRKNKGRKKPSGTHKPRFRNTDFRWQDRISVHYRIAVRFYPVS